MNIEEPKQKIAEEEVEAKVMELRKPIELRAQKLERAKEQLYFACEKLCDAVLSARHYCPETVQRTIDDSVRHWTEIRKAMN